MIRAVFVYGTLKRGQCRGGLWPAEPLSIEVAWVRGTLFGRHDYPAMTAGEDRILGERWEFDAADFDRVIQTLDQIEGTNQPGRPDLYLRVHLQTWDLQGHSLGDAVGYRYATDPRQDGFILLDPAEDGFVRWPAE